MTDNPNRELLKKYFTGKCTSAEELMVEEFIRKEENSTLLDEVLMELVLDIKSEDVVLPEKQMDFYFQEVERKIADQKLKEPIKINTKTRKSIVWIAGLAAACMMIFWLFHNFYIFSVFTGANSAKNYKAAMDRPITKFLLPDSSVMWLTAGSEVETEREFGNKNRNVNIRSGEVYFDVKRNEDLYFIVTSPHTTTKVLGTSFLVCDQPDLNIANVKVTRGKVEIKAGGKVFKNLTMGKCISYNKETNTAELSRYDQILFDPDEKSLFIDDAPFDELAFRIKQVYGYSLKSSSTTIKAGKFTLELDFEKKLNEVMDNLAWLYNCSYEIKGKEVYMK